MAVLGGDELQARLNRGQVFKPDTWDEEGVMEASYALRLAWDGLVVDGDPYPPGAEYKGNQIRVEPGRIAILSTHEVIQMPGDLTGKVGVRLDFAALGLVGLMGIQVDPYYGSEWENEKLYFRVANMSNETIRLNRTDRVFNLELHEARGARRPKKPKQRGWDRMQSLLRSQRDASWTYITRVEHDVRAIEERFHPLILFGVVLLAVTILGVITAVILDTDASSAPPWIANWGWIVLLLTFVAAAAATVAIVTAEAFRVVHKALRR